MPKGQRGGNNNPRGINQYTGLARVNGHRPSRRPGPPTGRPVSPATRARISSSLKTRNASVKAIRRATGDKTALINISKGKAMTVSGLHATRGPGAPLAGRVDASKPNRLTVYKRVPYNAGGPKIKYAGGTLIAQMEWHPTSGKVSSIFVNDARANGGKNYRRRGVATAMFRRNLGGGMVRPQHDPPGQTAQGKAWATAISKKAKAK